MAVTRNSLKHRKNKSEKYDDAVAAAYNVMHKFRASRNCYGQDCATVATGKEDMSIAAANICR